MADLFVAEPVKGLHGVGDTPPASKDAVAVLPVLANAAAPTLTEGTLAYLSTDLAGNLRVTVTNQASGTTSGNLTNNNAAPGANNIGALTALAASAAPTYTSGDQVLLVTDLAGNLNTNANLQFGGAGITGANPLPVTLAGDTANIKTVGIHSTNTAAPVTDLLGVLPAVANAAAPTYLEGDGVLLSTTLAGALRVILANIPQVTGTQTNNNAAPGAANFGVLPAVATTAAPTYTTGNAVALSTDTAGNLRVTMAATANQPVSGNLTNNNAAPAANNVGALTALANAASPTWTEGNEVLLSADLTGRLRTTIPGLTGNNAGAPGINLLGTLAAVATTAAPTYTTGNLVALSTDTSGNLRVILGATTTVQGNLTNNNSASPTNYTASLVAVATTTSPTYTTGNLVALSTDTQGNLRVVANGSKTNNNTAPAVAGQVGVLPSVANAAAPTLTEGFQTLLSQDLSGRLRALLDSTSTPSITANGSVVSTANPLPVVLEIGNAADAAGNPLYVTGTRGNNTAAPGTTNIGALVALANAAAPSNTEGNEVLLSTDLSGNLRSQANIFVAGAAASATNPVPVTIELGGAPDGPANPLPAYLISRGTVRDSGQLTSASLAPGGTVTIAHPTAQTAAAHVLEMTASASIRIKVDLQTKLNTTVTTLRTFIVDPIGDGLAYKAPDITTLTVPTGTTLQMKFTNLDNQITADVYGSLTYADF